MLLTIKNKLRVNIKNMLRVDSLQSRHNERGSVSNHQPHGCLLNRLFRRRSKKTSELRVTGLCAGNSPGIGGFPAQRASNVENVSILWRHLVVWCCRVTGPLWGETTGDHWIPLAKASDAKLWCFLWCAPAQAVEQTIDMPMSWGTMALIVTNTHDAWSKVRVILQLRRGLAKILCKISLILPSNLWY